jgi:hypothetical protein
VNRLLKVQLSTEKIIAFKRKILKINCSGFFGPNLLLKTQLFGIPLKKQY